MVGISHTIAIFLIFKQKSLLFSAVLIWGISEVFDNLLALGLEFFFGHIALLILLE